MLYHCRDALRVSIDQPLLTSDDAVWIFGFGSEDVWSEHSGQILAAHLVAAGEALDLIQEPSHAHTHTHTHTHTDAKQERGW